MLDERKEEAFCTILREELQLATGCTEPIAVAYCAARLRQVLGQRPCRILAEVSGNILKNVKSVVVPNTGGRRGLPAAIAVGMVAGDPEARLQVIAHVTEADAPAIGDYLDSTDIRIDCPPTPRMLDIRLTGWTGDGHRAVVHVANNHTNIIYVERDGEVLLEKPHSDSAEDNLQDKSVLNVRDILTFAETVDVSRIEDSVGRQIDCNTAIAREGLRGDWGANIGSTLLLSGGDVDFAMNLPEGDTSDPYPQTTLLLLNQRTGSLESESLRRALALAIDRNALTEDQPLDPAQGIVPPGLRNTMGGDFRQGSGSLIDNEPDNYEALCQQARTLLEEAGGVKAAGQITLLYDSTDETAARTAAAVQDAWKQKLGLIAILRGATAQELADALNQGEFMVALTTVTADRGDASGLLSLWESGNGYFYSTAYDMLLRAADASGHVEVRDAYLEDAEAMLVEDSWVIPLYYVHRHSGLAQQLTAPLYDGTGVYRFSAVVRQTPQ